MTINSKEHEVVLDYGQAMVENRKVGKFLDGIKFVPTHTVKNTDLDGSQMANSYTFNTD